MDAAVYACITCLSHQALRVRTNDAYLPTAHSTREEPSSLPPALRCRRWLVCLERNDGDDYVDDKYDDDDGDDDDDEYDDEEEEGGEEDEYGNDNDDDSDDVDDNNIAQYSISKYIIIPDRAAPGPVGRTGKVTSMRLVSPITLPTKDSTMPGMNLPGANNT
jgi:hypothetical protein